MRTKLPEVMAALQWTEWKRVSRRGVYMLMLKGVVQYIGKSLDVDRRVACHRKSQKIRFDAVRFAPVPHAYLARVERELLLVHVPLKNAIFPGTELGRELNQKFKDRRRPRTNWRDWHRLLPSVRETGKTSPLNWP